ncbi:MAG: DUF4832 domain-containing protein [Thermaceae bacterium]|nr:DUF4832 domain-containing protein [Thermaceae bacterium]
MQPVCKGRPRRWAGGQTTTVIADIALPEGVIPGEYDVLLYLPDASAKMARRPEYAIRRANQDV